MVMMMMVYEREGFAADDEKDDELHLLTFEGDIQKVGEGASSCKLGRFKHSTDPFAILTSEWLGDSTLSLVGTLCVSIQLTLSQTWSRV